MTLELGYPILEHSLEYNNDNPGYEINMPGHVGAIVVWASTLANAKATAEIIIKLWNEL